MPEMIISVSKGVRSSAGSILTVPSGNGPLGRSGLFLLSMVCACWLILEWLRARRNLRKKTSLVESFGGRVRLVEFFGVLALAATALLVAAFARAP